MLVASRRPGPPGGWEAHQEHARVPTEQVGAVRRPLWMEMPCADVRPLDVQALLDPITKKPASDSLALLR